MSHEHVSSKNVGDYAELQSNNYQELIHQRRIREIENMHEDSKPLAELTISNACFGEKVFQITDSEVGMFLNAGKMQISTKSEIGKFIAANLQNLKVGTELPNGGGKIVAIGFIRNMA